MCTYVYVFMWVNATNMHMRTLPMNTLLLPSVTFLLMEINPYQVESVRPWCNRQPINVPALISYQSLHYCLSPSTKAGREHPDDSHTIRSHCFIVVICMSWEFYPGVTVLMNKITHTFTVRRSYMNTLKKHMCINNHAKHPHTHFPWTWPELCLSMDKQWGQALLLPLKSV